MIFDDFGNELRKPKQKDAFQKFFFNSRHYRAMIVFNC